MLNCNKKYTVGWICATHTENVAAQEFLDEEHEDPESVEKNDNNLYTLGRIGKHNVVIAALPHGQYGLVNAASVARDMVHSFPNVRIGLLVGVGGGAPSAAHDIRLGDIVVSSAGHSSGGVFQHDFGKKNQGNETATTGFLNQPPMVLLNAIQTLRAKHERRGHQIKATVEATIQQNKRLRTKYQQPDIGTDRLYKSSVVHAGGDSDSCLAVCGSDSDKLIARIERSEDEDDPAIHYGLIASGNQLVRDAQLRDKLAQDRNILCFEMEAAGIVNHFPCLVIRGISDYCDTHKNKLWQGYASMTAAAYASELLSIIPLNKIEAEAPLIESLAKDLCDIKHDVAQVRASQVSTLERTILDWLTDVTYGNEHSDIRNRRLPNTSEWFLKTEEYRDWLDNSGQTLYCEGMPGAGKTIIASSVVDNLEISKKDDGIAYIYCNYKRAEAQTVENLLRTMLRQLLQTRPPVPEAVGALYKKHSARHTQPTPEEIRQILNSIVSSYPRVFIVIDALDECIGPDDCRSRYLEEVQHLQASYGVNVLATSRFLPEVRNKPPIRDSTIVELRAHDEDIQTYLDDRMSRFPSFVQHNIDLRIHVKHTIQGIINGMFLLARLYMDAIQERLTANGVNEALNSFGTNPDAYSGAYEAAIGRIESQKSDRLTYAKKLLSWISFAKRELSVSELEHALAVEPGAQGIDKGDIPDLQDVVSFCAGLVNIDHTSQVVKLVHLTAQTFLESKRAELLPNAEGDIARVCITYQCFDAFASGYCSTDDEYERRLQRYPLYSYAAHYWVQHSRISSQFECTLKLLKLRSHVQGSLQTLLLGEHPPRWRERYSQAPPQGATAAHLIAYLGLNELVSNIEENDLNAKTSDGRTPLIIAAEGGHEATVQLLIEHGASIDQTDNENCTPLLLAAKRDNHAVVQLLVQHSANIFQADNYGRTPLLFAISYGHKTVVQLLIAHGAPIDLVDNYNGLTPLFFAVTLENEEMVRLLIDHGAAVDQCSNDVGHTPLSYAAANGLTAIGRLLINDGAFVNTTNKCGQTPLLVSAQRGHTAVAKLLVELGAIFDEVDDGDARTPLSLAAEGGHEAVVELLIQHGARINQSDGYGRTPLFYAIAGSHKAVIRLLIEHGAAINHVNNNKRTPLVYASALSDEDVVQLLIKKGANINQADNFRWTPLSYAAFHGETAIAQLLIEKGANIGQVDYHGLSPLLLAAEGGHKAVVELLIQHGVNINQSDLKGQTSLLHATAGNYTAMIQLLIRRGADINQANNLGQTPLVLAIIQDHEEVVRLLADHGAAIDQADNKKCTPLVYAAMYSDKEVVQFLLGKGADINRADQDGVSPLSYAVGRGHNAVAQLLIDHGADIDQVDSDGWTPLSYAAWEGHDELVQLLLEQGANIKHSDKGGRTCLSFAVAQNHETVIEILLSSGATLDDSIELAGLVVWENCELVEDLLLHYCVPLFDDVFGLKALFG